MVFFKIVVKKQPSKNNKNQIEPYFFDNVCVNCFRLGLLLVRYDMIGS